MDILIVDDDERITSMLQEILESDDHRTRTARDVNEGYLAYLGFKPELVITDIQMSGKTGFELIKNIRTHNTKIKAIYMSGDPDQFTSLLEQEEKVYNTAFLKKPFSMDKLKDMIVEDIA